MLLFWGIYAVVALAVILLFRRWLHPYKSAYLARYGQPPSWRDLYYRRDSDPAIERMRLRLQVLWIVAIVFGFVAWMLAR